MDYSSKTVRTYVGRSNRSFSKYAYGMALQETAEHTSRQINRCSIHEGPILNAFGVVRMQFETAGAAPFILTGVKNSEQFRDLVLEQRDSLVSNPISHASNLGSEDIFMEIRDLLKSIDSKISE